MDAPPDALVESPNLRKVVGRLRIPAIVITQIAPS